MRSGPSLALALILGLAAACPRVATNYEDFEQACESICDTRVECLDVVPWMTADPPVDAADCTRSCIESRPASAECVASKTAYFECLGALTCEELAMFYDNPFSEVSRQLCFAEFEEASDCD